LSGIYIHIPFCRKACHYCNFHFSTSTQSIPQLIDAICDEIISKPIPSSINRDIQTIYFGGGTPSLLSESQLEKVLVTLKQEFNWDKSAEVTIETNPEDITAQYLDRLHQLGFNRLSVGIQSFNENDLQSMNRNHGAAQSHKALNLIQNSPIHNYNLDLMFGLFGRSIDEWRQNIKTALTYDPPHISCYNLTIEEQTAYQHLIKQRKIVESSDIDQSEQFRLAEGLLKDQGYSHYEISNYAKSGYQAIHNTNYWNRTPYMSYGPSAHSYDGYCRFWNVSNNQKYIQSIQDQTSLPEYDHLSEVSIYNEIIMLGLRTQKGISKNSLSKFPMFIRSKWNKSSSELISEGILIDTGDRIQLHRDWWYLSDAITVRLFCEDES